MSAIRKRTVWTRFPETIRRMRVAIYLHGGIPEETYPLAMRRVLYLANRRGAR